jgi:hypothetical protein
MTRGTARSLRGLVAALAVGALSCAGTTTQDYCPTVTASGGSVVGTWTTNNTTAFCAAPYDRVSNGDWCSQLVWDPSGIRLLMLGHPVLSFKTGTIMFTDANGQLTDAQAGNYTSMLHFETDQPETVWFPQACLEAYGRPLAATQQQLCDQLTGDFGQYLSDGSAANQSFRNLSLMQFPNYPLGTAPQAVYSTMDCNADMDRGGCACKYLVGLDVPDKGQWGTQDGTLTLFSAASAPAYGSDYGVGKDANGQFVLAVSGQAGVDLLGQTGLRMLSFAKQ